LDLVYLEQRYARYYVEFSDGLSLYYDNSSILRLLTPEEIEEYEVEKSMKKYNL
jgi:hypothetical protein